MELEQPPISVNDSIHIGSMMMADPLIHQHGQCACQVKHLLSTVAIKTKVSLHLYCNTYLQPGGGDNPFKTYI